MTIQHIEQRIQESAANLQRLAGLAPTIDTAAQTMTHALRRGNKILFCGNGGSAADSQHLAAELQGRFLRERKPLAAIALTTDTSVLTAIGNDYGYEQVFARQLGGLGSSGDVLVAISTSGNSINVVEAAHTARRKAIHVIALTGASGGALADHADIALKVPANRTDLIQEMHIVTGHILCGLVEEAIAK